MTKDEILNMLRSASAPISGEEMSRALGVSRAGGLEGRRPAPAGGLRHRGRHAPGLSPRRPARPAGRRGASPGIPGADVHVYEEVTSTNSVARQLAADGCPAGTMRPGRAADPPARARRGRGFGFRGGRALFQHRTPPRPAAGADHAPHGDDRRRHPPRDFGNNGAGRRHQVDKRSRLRPQKALRHPDRAVHRGGDADGGLCRRRDRRQLQPDRLRPGNRGHRGLHPHGDRQTGRPPEPAGQCDAAPDARARAELQSGRAAWLAEFAAHCITIGQPVQIIRGDTVREAFAEGIDDEAALLVRYPDGTREAVNSGESRSADYMGMSPEGGLYNEQRSIAEYSDAAELPGLYGAAGRAGEAEGNRRGRDVGRKRHGSPGAEDRRADRSGGDRRAGTDECRRAGQSGRTPVLRRAGGLRRADRSGGVDLRGGRARSSSAT